MPTRCHMQQENERCTCRASRPGGGRWDRRSNSIRNDDEATVRRPHGGRQDMGLCNSSIFPLSVQWG
eukprot:14314585-Alexandrium_andersonii.AAC.1